MIIKPEITAVLITDNNVECINAIESVLDSCNEVIVVNTVETTEVNKAVEKFGDKVKVVYFKWCNDFSRARNYGIKKASGDWILTIDSDEILETKIEIGTKVGGNGKIFGSISAIQISEVLKGKGVEIDRRKISIKEGDIKEVGSYTVVIALTKEQSVELPLEIFAE